MTAAQPRYAPRNAIPAQAVIQGPRGGVVAQYPHFCGGDRTEQGDIA